MQTLNKDRRTIKAEFKKLRMHLIEMSRFYVLMMVSSFGLSCAPSTSFDVLDYSNILDDSIALEYSIVKGADNVPILVAEGGNPDGEVIVFIHGMSQSHLSWLPQFESELSDHYRLIGYDLRGHGGSGKPWEAKDYSASRRVWADDLKSILQEKDVEKATIVAWSFGGYVAISYIRAYGIEKIDALVLSGTLAGLADIPKEDIPPLSQDALEGSRNRGSLNLLENISGYSSMPDSFTFNPMSQTARQISETTALMQPSYVRRAMTDLPLSNSDMLDQLSLPVLLAIGDKDNGTPKGVAVELSTSLKTAELSIYPNTGHFPSYEKTDRFNCEVRGLIQSKALNLDCQRSQNNALRVTPNLTPCSGQPFCDIMRPEDISLIPQTDWAIVSDSSGKDIPLRLINSSLTTLANEIVVHKESGALEAHSDCKNSSKPKEFRGHAVGIVMGKQTFAVINAAVPAAVETYAIQFEDTSPLLVRQSCIPIPEHLNLNDVALGPDGAIYASHMFSQPIGPVDKQKLMDQLRAKVPTGNVVVWRKGEGWQSIVGTELSFPNGVAINDNGRVLAVSGTYSQAIKFLDLETHEISSITLPIQPDNITALNNDRFMVVGHSGVPLTGIEACRPPEARPCGFPFMAFEIDENYKTKRIYQHDGRQHPGASVVVPWKEDKLLFGTAFGDRLTIVNRQ